MYQPEGEAGSRGIGITIVLYRGGGGSQAGSTASNRDSFTEGVGGGSVEISAYSPPENRRPLRLYS